MRGHGDVVSISTNMLAPAYPRRLYPWTCPHGPAYEVQADARIVTNERGHNYIEIEHRVCLACGTSRNCHFGGNVLVDLTMICQRQARHLPMFTRAWYLRSRWTRIALKLFGPDGWNGRHERVARTIDPHLTMRLEAIGEDIGRCSYDESYLRPEIADAEVATKRVRRAKATRCPVPAAPDLFAPTPT